MRTNRLAYLAAGILIGAAAGFILGVLLAPSSGARTRQALGERARTAAETARFFAERAEDAAGTLGRQVEHYLGRDEEVAWRRVREIREGVDRYTEAQHG